MTLLAEDPVAEPLLSVIIPVYNVEEYLPLCLQSVVEQTLPGIEIVCVNDGSTDASGELLEKAAALDGRIRIVTKPNGGLSSARNAGIDAAHGRYLCFLDSDDLMAPEACEIIVAAFEATDADVVTYGAEVYPPFRSYYWLETVLSPRDRLFEGFDPAVLFEEQSHPFAWRTACNRSFLVDSGVRFDETLPFGEDQVFHFQLYPRARRTVLIEDKLVRYRVTREGSLMNQRSADPVRRTSEHIAIVSHILDDWDAQGFLAPAAQELFDWIIEFVAIDVLSFPLEDRIALADSLRDVLRAHFAPAFLERQLAHPVHGFMVRALLGDDPAVDAGTPRSLRVRYFGARDGWPATAARSARSVRTIIRDKVRPYIRTRGDKLYAQREAQFEIADRGARADALAWLRGTGGRSAL